jgi:hypothetical protein
VSEQSPASECGDGDAVAAWSGSPPAERVRRLVARARLCGEPYVFVSGRWVLGATDAERRAGLRLLARWRLHLIVADEDVTVTPRGRELRHARPRDW